MVSPLGVSIAPGARANGGAEAVAAAATVAAAPRWGAQELRRPRSPQQHCGGGGGQATRRGGVVEYGCAPGRHALAPRPASCQNGRHHHEATPRDDAARAAVELTLPVERGLWQLHPPERLPDGVWPPAALPPSFLALRDPIEWGQRRVQRPRCGHHVRAGQHAALPDSQRDVAQRCVPPATHATLAVLHHRASFTPPL